MFDFILCTKCAEKVALLFLICGTFFISISPTITAILFVLATVTYWCNKGFAAKWQVVKKNPLTYWILALLLLFIIGATYSEGSRQDISLALSKDAKFIFLPLLLPLLALGKNQKYVVNSFIISVIFIVTMAFFKIYNHPILNYSLDVGCAFNNHIQTSLEVALAIFILGHEFLNHKNLACKMMYILLVAFLTVYLVFYNQGRSGLLLFVILVGVLLLQRFALKIVMPLLAGFIVVLISLFHFSNHVHQTVTNVEQHVVSTLRRDPNATQTSEGMRMAFWHHSIKLIKTRPLFGYGTGGFVKAYQRFNGQTTITTNPHNEYLNFGVQLGVIGILFLIAFYSYLLYLSRRLVPELKYIAQGVVVSYMIGCLYNSWLMDAMIGYLFIVLVAACFAKVSVENSSCLLNCFRKSNRLPSP